MSLPLLLLPLSSVWFYALYLFCGFTDMIDGTIARKAGAVSHFGARLDTLSDLVFFIACGIKILPRVELPVWLWVWITLLALVKIFHIATVLSQRKKLISIHSVFNKITGLALFLFPLTLPVAETAYSGAILCMLATVATMHEVCFVAKGKEVVS